MSLGTSINCSIQGFKDELAYQDDVLATGLPASPGAAVGRVVFTADEAEAWAKDGKKVILVRIETSPEDVGGMDAAQGILTSRGGMTSHAAVVARGWGKPCVAGCGDIVISYATKSFKVGHRIIHEGDWISINGSSGEVILGAQELVSAQMSEDFAIFMEWTDEVRPMGVRTNADTPGRCRKGHLFRS